VVLALVAASWLAGRFTAGAGTASGRPTATSSSSGAGASGRAAQSQLGPVIAAPPPPGGGSGGGQNPPPFRTLADAAPGIPAIGVSQPAGDPDTVFVVRGQWWPAGKPVTITLVGVGTSPVHPIADQDGSFNYAINQGHEFFAGLPAAGTYTLRVTDAAGASAEARFEVT